MLAFLSLLCQVSPSELNYGAFFNSPFLGLLYSSQQLNTHQNIIRQIFNNFSKQYVFDFKQQVRLSKSKRYYFYHLSSFIFEDIIIFDFPVIYIDKITMDPNQSEQIVHSPKEEIDYSKLSQAEREAEFRRRRQEYLAEKQARKREIKKRKRQQFGQTSSDSSDSDEAASRSSGSSAVKSQKKTRPEPRQQLTPTKLEVETKQQKLIQQQISPVKKKSESLERIGVNVQSRKSNEWVKDVLVIGQKTIIIQNFTQQVKKFSKIKIIAEPILGSPYKIKISLPDQETIFSIGAQQQKYGLSCHYYTFAKLVQIRLTESGIKLKQAVQQKIPGVPQNLIAGSIIYGRIHKKSQVLGNWEQRFVLINKEGIFSYKKFNQKHSMFIAAGSINELWTRFEIQDNLLIVKIWHTSKKTEFGFPLTDCISVHSWLYGFYCMMGRAK